MLMKLNKLKELRQKRNITYEDMAKICGISKSYYWQIENGYRKLSYNRACEIASVFNTKPDLLFYEEFMKNKSD